jgi:hypothetical protein
MTDEYNKYASVFTKSRIYAHHGLAIADTFEALKVFAKILNSSIATSGTVSTLRTVAIVHIID